MDHLGMWGERLFIEIYTSFVEFVQFEDHGLPVLGRELALEAELADDEAYIVAGLGLVGLSHGGLGVGAVETANGCLAA